MAKAAQEDLDILQIDVNTIFLNPSLKEDIYMELPQLFELIYPQFKTKKAYMKLLKTLYGLKQAPREWFLIVKDFFESLGLKSADSDPNLFVSKGVYILLFVDNILIIGDKIAYSITKAKIMKYWKCKELIGELFVGFQIDRNRKRRSIKIHQTFYTTKLLERLRMDKSNPTTLLIPARTIVRTDKSDMPLRDDDSFIYSQIVGSTIYLSNGTRPDIAYTIGQLASVIAKPFTIYLQLTK